MADAAERKRKRLEAWRKRQKQKQPPKVLVKMNLSNKRCKNKTARAIINTVPTTNPFGDDGTDDDDNDNIRKSNCQKPLLNFGDQEDLSRRGKKGSRWDVFVGDALDSFMEKLSDGVMGNIATQKSEVTFKIDVDGFIARDQKKQTSSGQTVTTGKLASSKQKKKGCAFYTDSDWNNSASKLEIEDEKEEKARRNFIEALKSTPRPDTIDSDILEDYQQELRTAAQVKTEKQRREDRLRELEVEAGAARHAAEAAAAPEFGRLYNDAEDGVMEEAERNLDAAMAAPDALDVLAELNKKKELKSVNHSIIKYITFRKNLYIVPRSLAKMTNDEVINKRAKLKIRLRGKCSPAPVTSFTECGVSERIINILKKQNILTPYPVQAQCIPCIMAGRDVIGIAKTGSGKTLAYLLPLLRHVGDQPPLGPQESGPIGLILAPARELATQIHSVCKTFCKHMGLKSTVVYGGAAVAEQIGDLKRGVHICVATPGRLIDILTMQSGKILSLQRVTYVVLDEADRIFDMGFSSQIGAILAAVRPDRQTVLFSATFPKAVEEVAKKSLQYPIEVIVGGRSVASDNVIQYAEVVEDDSKFLRLLQLLGEHVDDGKKVIIFVRTQAKADSIFEQLLRCGYVSLSLHGGKDQEDRDSTISDFKRKDGPRVLVATGLAGRGLDVPSCGCVINYSTPNHLEAYVHQVGRTGRAGRKGLSYTFVNSADEAMYAPIVTRALTEAGQAENISLELKELSDSFKEKVKRGEAKYAGSGFKGKGFSYDSTELSEAQKLARLEKRQALIEAGLLDPDDEDSMALDPSNSGFENTDQDENSGMKVLGTTSDSIEDKLNDEIQVPEKLTPELLALPGMKQAILKKVGIIQSSKSNGLNENDIDSSMGKIIQLGNNHFLQEVEINDYPREARWKVTQKDTTSRLQDEFQTAVTLKGSYFAPGRAPVKKERRLYLHLEATSERILKKCVLEIQRLLNEETLRVSARGNSSTNSHKYSVL